jgi:hypothetical protein
MKHAVAQLRDTLISHQRRVLFDSTSKGRRETLAVDSEVDERSTSAQQVSISLNKEALSA